MNTAKGMYVNGNPVYFKDDNVRNFISDEYSEDKTYAVGDYCINDNKLYMCTAPTSGGFDGSCWKQTNMSAEVSEQNKNLSALGGFTPIIDETGKITGYKTSVGGADTVFPFTKPSFLKVGTWTKSFTSGHNFDVLQNEYQVYIYQTSISQDATSKTSRLLSPFIDITNYKTLTLAFLARSPVNNPGDFYTPKIYLQDSSGSNVATMYAQVADRSDVHEVKLIDFDISSFSGNHRVALSLHGYGDGGNSNNGTSFLVTEACLS